MTRAFHEAGRAATRWLWLCALGACASSQHPPSIAPTGGCEHGSISYYAARFDGHRTASGETYKSEGMSAAHRHLPFGTRLAVSVGGRRVHVRVNDRGPFARARILDVSAKAARELGIVQRGHADADVCVE